MPTSDQALLEKSHLNGDNAEADNKLNYAYGTQAMNLPSQAYQAQVEILSSRPDNAQADDISINGYRQSEDVLDNQYKQSEILINKNHRCNENVPNNSYRHVSNNGYRHSENGSENGYRQSVNTLNNDQNIQAKEGNWRSSKHDAGIKQWHVILTFLI